MRKDMTMHIATLHLTKPTGLHRRLLTGTALCKLGWLFFIISMLLPAAQIFDGWLYGWQCAWIVLVMAWNALTSGGSGYLETLALANVGMVATPFLLRVARKSARVRAGLSVLTLMMALLVTWLPLREMSIRELGVGYYLWAASFWLLFAGSCRLRSQTIRKSPPVPAFLSDATNEAKTPERLAAERELEACLQGANQ